MLPANRARRLESRSGSTPRREASLSRARAAAALLCGALGASPASGAEPWLPLAPGNHWSYAVTKQRLTEIEGRQNALQSFEERSTDRVTPLGERWIVETSVERVAAGGAAEPNLGLRTVFSSDEHGVYLHSQSLSGQAPETLESGAYDPPLRYLRLPLEAGKRWSMGTIRMGGLEIKMTAELERFESVEAAGTTFEGAARVRAQGTISGSLTLEGERIEVESGSVDETTWLARGVGIVRLDSLTVQKLKLADGTRVTASERKKKLLEPSYRAARAEPAAPAASARD